MNEKIQKYAKDSLKADLQLCDEAEQHMFKRMYAKGKMELTIDEVVDNMDETNLDRAMDQVQRTLDRKLINSLDN